MSSLQQAVQLSEDIEIAISELDLDKVSKLDNKRQVLIKQYYQSGQTIDRDLTLKLKQMNDSIADKLLELKQKTRQQQNQLNLSRNASNAYQNNLPK